MDTKKVLITGASGFIGSFLVEKALSKGFEVWAGIRKSSNKEYLQDKRIHFIDLYLSDKQKLTQQLIDFVDSNGEFNYVIHNAGITKCLNQKDFDKINFQCTANLIDSLKAAKCMPEKFVLMSSLSAYGIGDEINYTPIKLTDTPNPNTAYGISKIKAENYLKQSDVPYIILRPTGVYGPREKDYFIMIKTVKSGLDIGAGFKPQHLTFIYVRDLADAVFMSLERPLVNKEYFVADGDVYTDKEYTSLIKEVLGKKYLLSVKVPIAILKVVSATAEWISQITHKPSTLNNDKFKIMKQRNWECDTYPLLRDLDFKPHYNLKKGLEESVQWYYENGWLK